MSGLAKSYLGKGRSYVSSSSHIYWDKLNQDLDSIVSKLRKHYNHSQFITIKDKNEEYLDLCHQTQRKELQFQNKAC